MPINAQETQALKIGLYTPNGPLVGTSKRHAYIRQLASVIQNKTGITTSGKAFIRYGDLIKEKVDFAIIDGVCIAAKNPGRVLATMSIDGTKRSYWGLFTRKDQTFKSLKNKKIAFVNSGCRNLAFIFNGMLKGEVPNSYFSKTISKPSIDGAIASVQGFKIADAVFAPTTYPNGLVQLFQSTVVPNPAFLQMNKDIQKELRIKIVSILKGFTVNRLSWGEPLSYRKYGALFAKKTKQPLFIPPQRVKIELKELIQRPKFTFRSASVMHLLREPKK